MQHERNKMQLKKNTKTPKNRDAKIGEAVEALNKAMALDSPDIQILFPYGLDEDRDKELVKSLREFVNIYKKHRGNKKLDIKFLF